MRIIDDLIPSKVGIVTLSVARTVILSAVEGWGRYRNRFDCAQLDSSDYLS